MARLLVVHHTPSPSLHTMLEACLDGTRADGLDDVEVVVRPALSATVVDALSADAYLLGTPANLGYMSGALKHFFDLAYYPCLDATAGRAFGLFVHGDNDPSGASSAVDRIATGLAWRRVADHVEVCGAPDRRDRDACWNLGATLALAAAESLD